MELTHAFDVSVAPDEAWAVLTDLERIAPCLPGARLDAVEGDEHRGTVKVKVGPITAQYKGTARFRELDRDAGRAVLEASGRDTRGQGNASAVVTATMVPAGEGTHVTVVTDLTVTGKVAQFGRGVLADVSAKLLDQFVANLETTVLRPSMVEPPAASAEPPAPEPTTPQPTTPQPPAPEPVDLLGTAGGPLAKRLLPLLGVAAVVVVLLGWWRRRRRG